MRYFPPMKPKNAVIFVRSDPEKPCGLSPELQEEQCLAYCSENRIPVSRVVRVHGDSDAALQVLRELLCTLPMEVDTIFAARLLCYTERLRELGLLCLQFQCRPTWLCSLDYPLPIYRVLPVFQPKDFEEADRRYLETLEAFQDRKDTERSVYP